MLDPQVFAHFLSGSASLLQAKTLWSVEVLQVIYSYVIPHLINRRR